MKMIVSAFFLLSSTVAAFAAPQGTWPDQARDLPLGKPKWVLVVPATRDAAGSIVLWDRSSDWTKAWVVPRATPNGIRTVSISGDSEDQKVIHPDQVDNMSSETLKTLANKYAADAVAVVVRDAGSDVAVAAWKRGQHATWMEAVGGTDGRVAALSTIDALYSGSGVDAPAADASVAVATPGQITVLAQRFNQSMGVTEYRLAADAASVARLAASPSLTVTGTGEGTADVVVTDGRDIGDVIVGL